jgi:hypothetical protein
MAKNDYCNAETYSKAHANPPAARLVVPGVANFIRRSTADVGRRVILGPVKLSKVSSDTTLRLSLTETPGKTSSYMRPFFVEARFLNNYEKQFPL